MNKNMMISFMGKVVKVDRGGPESRVGRIIAVKNDYFAMLTEEEGLIFYQHHHVKSVTRNTSKEFKFQSSFLDNFKFKAPIDFRCVLDSLIDFKVKINRGGKESMEGILNEANDDFVGMLTNEEVVHMSLFHIRNISYDIKKEKYQVVNESSNKEENQNNESKNKENNQSRRSNRNKRDGKRF